MSEPIAWMARNELLFSVVKDEIHYIPLYTHPVKELTDEEIMSEWEKSKDEVDFARAILRKAQNG